MHPVLFEIGSFTVYSYGFCIAIGAILGFLYVYRQGKKKYQITFDQSNNLFLLLVTAAVVGGKFFLIFENPSLYLHEPKRFFSGNGFVFYGSLLTAIPVMLWYFKKIKVPALGMLDIMAVVTCIVHGFGRIGCLMAGCCYGTPTDSIFGIIFTDPACQAQPLGTPLHPTQLYEVTWIALLFVTLIIIEKKKQFDGQLFLIYLMLYAVGRSIIEIFRGDIARGFVIDGILSNSQFISLLLIFTAVYFYLRLRKKSQTT
jgi:phosphatidylglycerol:prolipoprotein diacylglycerol transferase